MLAINGMNPFGNLSTKHLVIYLQLISQTMHEEKYMMLSMIISSPRQPINDIDVCLDPLVEDLNFLWVDGIQIFDEFANETFMMHVLSPFVA